MSTDNSSSKWLVGCLIAAAVAVLLCGGGIALIGFFGYQVAQQVGPQMEVLEFAVEWQAPAADAGVEELLPETVMDWSRTDHEETAALSELAITHDGVHGTYTRDGTNIDVYAYRVAVHEKAGVFTGAQDAIDSAGYSTRTQATVDLGTYQWMTFSFNPPQRYGRMWWAQDWLIVTITDDPAVNLESFERNYLDAVSAPAINMEPVQVAPATEPLAVESDEPTAPAEPQPVEPAADETAPAEPETAPDDPDAAPDNPETAPDDPEAAPADPTVE